MTAISLDRSEAEELSDIFERTDWDSISAVAKVVNIWADTVFPDRVAEHALAKLAMEEIPELLIHRKKHGTAGIGTELADCIILLFDLAVLWGVDLENALLQKMHKNVDRTWGKDTATGFYNHLENDNEDSVQRSGDVAEGVRRETLDDRPRFEGTDCRGTSLQSVVPGTVIVRSADGWHYPQLIRTASGCRLGACARCGRNLDWGSALAHQEDTERTVARDSG
jgi:NTP pyrophosphatase (non-canonical NTP hydrolase)